MNAGAIGLTIVLYVTGGLLRIHLEFKEMSFTIFSNDVVSFHVGTWASGFVKIIKLLFLSQHSFS